MNLNLNLTDRQVELLNYALIVLQSKTNEKYSDTQFTDKYPTFKSILESDIKDIQILLNYISEIK